MRTTLPRREHMTYNNGSINHRQGDEATRSRVVNEVARKVDAKILALSGRHYSIEIEDALLANVR